MKNYIELTKNSMTRPIETSLVPYLGVLVCLRDLPQFF